ncbi:hypothetical protein [Actinomadura nitritigenes]|uniref:hypothetical protein n=1 Tax=Actinomadura nitritigenes TaxID=134602 RepID=UPI003D8B6E57
MNGLDPSEIFRVEATDASGDVLFRLHWLNQGRYEIRSPEDHLIGILARLPLSYGEPWGVYPDPFAHEPEPTGNNPFELAAHWASEYGADRPLPPPAGRDRTPDQRRTMSTGTGLTDIKDRPADDELIARLVAEIEEMHLHDHDRPDLYCFQRTFELGQYMPVVLARLRDAEAVLAGLRGDGEAVADEAYCHNDPLLSAIEELPASDSLLLAIASDLADMRHYEATGARLFRFNRTVEIGEHMAAVMARVRDSEATLAELHAHVRAVAAEADRHAGVMLALARNGEHGSSRDHNTGREMALERGADELAAIATKLREHLARAHGALLGEPATETDTEEAPE